MSEFSLLGAALFYASVGLRVFPLSPGSKVPFKGSNGCLDATSNEELIRDWWERDPDSNVGIATGFLVDVVDIDGTQGQLSRVERWCAKGAECETRAMKKLPWDVNDCDHGAGFFRFAEEICVAKVFTPRRPGMHIYVPAQGRGNKAAMYPGVDYRGERGYVVAPPSVTDVGTYRFLGTPNLAGLA